LTRDLTLLLVAAAGLGWFATGQYTWMAVWLPELFPTRIRATGAGLVFNAPRFIAWVGPLTSGTLIATFGGFITVAASRCPTHRDFVPWRFSDAGRLSGWIGLHAGK
jgi:hypothetical protein